MTTRQILHIDMDAFYASVEQRDDPALRGKPVIVGGSARRGIVTAASYEARPFGVRSAMPMAEAMRRCPQAIVVPGRHHVYAEVSEQLFEIFERFTPLVEALSLDEAFLDVTASRALFGDGVSIAGQIKAAIQKELRLTASAGVAPCKFAAKIASDLDKPDGLVVVPEDVAKFLAPLPVGRMWGVGPVAGAQLNEAGFHSIGDLAAAERGELEALLGSWGANVWELAHGIDNRPVEPGRSAKSLGAEDTFERDLRGEAELLVPILAQCERVARRLFRRGVYARVLVLKIKHADFTLRTSRVTLPEPAYDTEALFAAARAALARLDVGRRPVRLTGIAAADLMTGPVQQPLFDDRKRAAHEKLEAVTDEIKEKFGSASITRGTVLRR